MSIRNMLVWFPPEVVWARCDSPWAFGVAFGPSVDGDFRAVIYLGRWKVMFTERGWVVDSHKETD